MEDPTAYLKQLKDILQPQLVDTPDFDKLPSPTATPPVIKTSGTTTTPDGATTSSSTPATPNPLPVASTVLDQGAAFKQSISTAAVNIPTAPVKTVKKTTVSPITMFVKDAEEAPVAPRIKYIEVPKKCPPPPKCPTPPKCPPQVQCPDMRPYIRKDSIPCWSCKLG